MIMNSVFSNKIKVSLERNMALVPVQFPCNVLQSTVQVYEIKSVTTHECRSHCKSLLTVTGFSSQTNYIKTAFLAGLYLPKMG